MTKWLSKTILKKCMLAIAGGLVVVWALYGAFGHPAIEAMYKSDSPIIINQIMQGRSITPLADYLRGADRLMLVNTFRALTVLLILILLLRGPWIPLYACASVFLFVLILFGCLEVYPPLAETLHLDAVEYYADRKLFTSDAVLAYKGKPRLNITMYKPSDARHNGTQGRSSPTLWTTDDEGFRNVNPPKFSNIVLLGDGMITSGSDWEDTFGKRLENHLPGWSVGNLGIPGHGPFQYLEVLRTYGVKRRPQYAIFSFNEGNDLQDIRKYIQWKSESTSTAVLRGGYEVGITAPVLRFTTAYSQTFKYLKQISWQIAETVLLGTSLRESDDLASRDIALVRLLTNRTFPMRFIDEQQTKSMGEIQKSEDWQELKGLLTKFRTICVEHGITPLFLFIPTANHIYAQYSTDESGANWLKIRDQQIQAKTTLENALIRLNHELGIFFLSLSSTFESAAKDGFQVYDSFSVHINSQGTELAATYVSHILQSKFDARRTISQTQLQSAASHM